MGSKALGRHPFCSPCLDLRKVALFAFGGGGFPRGRAYFYALVRHLGTPKLKTVAAGIRLFYPAAISYADSFFLCLAGPLFSLAAFFLSRGSVFSLYSLGLAAVNLIPASCFDGGGMLSSLSYLLLPYEKAAVLCRAVSAVSVLFLVFFNTLIQIKAGFNITLMAVTVYTAVTVMGDGA